MTTTTMVAELVAQARTHVATLEKRLAWLETRAVELDAELDALRRTDAGEEEGEDADDRGDVVGDGDDTVWLCGPGATRAQTTLLRGGNRLVLDNKYYTVSLPLATNDDERGSKAARAAVLALDALKWREDLAILMDADSAEAKLVWVLDAEARRSTSAEAHMWCIEAGAEFVDEHEDDDAASRVLDALSVVGWRSMVRKAPEVATVRTMPIPTGPSQPDRNGNDDPADLAGIMALMDRVDSHRRDLTRPGGMSDEQRRARAAELATEMMRLLGETGDEAT